MTELHVLFINVQIKLLQYLKIINKMFVNLLTLLFTVKVSIISENNSEHSSEGADIKLAKLIDKHNIETRTQNDNSLLYNYITAKLSTLT